MGAAPPQEAPAEPTRATWFLAHPYPMPLNFTGRAAEREMLRRWLDEDGAHPLLVLRALGGFGKSALTWHWLLHDVAPRRWPRVAWWSFYDERSGYVLQGADARLFLARMALEEGDRGAAQTHAREARRQAACDGPPDYTYRVAYEEAGALLAQMGDV